MKILVVGGGSGGHVTPVIAVIKEIKALHPRARIRFLTDRKFYSVVVDLLKAEGLRSVRVSKIAAGKFRRYSHFGVLDYIKHPSIMLANLVDGFKVVGGTLHSWLIILGFRPDVVFVKGGYVGLPVGLAAGLLVPRVPLVIHDSDTAAGLTNRILSRFAKRIATGMPLENYNYAAEKSIYTGIPIDKIFRPSSARRREELKREFDFDPKQPLAVVTGGGLGAKRLNEAILGQLDQLLPHVQVALIAGKEQYSEVDGVSERAGFRLFDFLTTGFEDLLGAADIVVSRAGATTIVELAAMSKATILVPNAMLPSSHQVKNAQMLSDADAVVIVDDDAVADKPEVLTKAILGLVGDEPRRAELGVNLHKLAKPEAAKALAEIIVGAAAKNG
jgi:UDP-N-acetylglucosamine--N-acetylmuramyl-(pentapeptide) pyrophosphoryl-undecaprenol N-acetylglucosamine transferase